MMKIHANDTLAALDKLIKLHVEYNDFDYGYDISEAEKACIHLDESVMFNNLISYALTLDKIHNEMEIPMSSTRSVAKERVQKEIISFLCAAQVCQINIQCDVTKIQLFYTCPPGGSMEDPWGCSQYTMENFLRFLKCL